MSRLKEQYENEIKDAMIKKFGYKNTMEVPKLDKIVVNMGVGEAKENAKLLEAAVKDMEAITGQKSRTRGNAKLIRRSANSYIFSPRKVTLHPIGMFSLILKFAIAFLAFVVTAF